MYLHFLGTAICTLTWPQTAWTRFFWAAANFRPLAANWKLPNRDQWDQASVVKESLPTLLHCTVLLNVLSIVELSSTFSTRKVSAALLVMTPMPTLWEAIALSASENVNSLQPENYYPIASWCQISTYLQVNWLNYYSLLPRTLLVIYLIVEEIIRSRPYTPYN